MKKFLNIGLKIGIGAGMLMAALAHSQAAAPWTFFDTRSDHSCALVAGGTAYCWGNNQSGVLGKGNEDEISKVPTLIKTDLKFSSISPGINHTCAITTAGKAYCWGRNDRFQLGMAGADDPRASYPSMFVPTPVRGDLVFTSISAGYFHTCGLAVGGKAYCWGAGYNGELGSDTQATSVPTAVKGNIVFASVIAGRSLSCGLTAGGEAYCWGANGSNQFGDGTTIDNFKPQPAGNGILFSSISLGELHVCGISKDKKAYCWGSGRKGKLGNGSALDNSQNPKPLEVLGKYTFTSISASIRHTCALTPAGKAYCWGSNNNMQLGVPVADDQAPEPVAVNTQLVFSSIYTANGFTCAIATNKHIYCWGYNAFGQLGDDSTKSRIRPDQVELP